MLIDKSKEGFSLCSPQVEDRMVLMLVFSMGSTIGKVGSQQQGIGATLSEDRLIR
jgi:hypothetical protein